MAGSREFELIFKLQAAVGANFKSSFLAAKNATKDLESNIRSLNNTSRDISGYRKTQASLKASTAELAAQKEELARLRNEQNATGGSSKRLAADIAKQEEKILKTKSAIKRQNESLGEYKSRLNEAGVDIKNLSSETERLASETDKARQAQERMAKIGALQADNRKAISETRTKLMAVTGAATAFGVAMYMGPIKSAMTFESSMADVAKVVDGLKDSSGAFTGEYHEMKNEILDLTSKIPMTANELTKIAAAAGQAGIARKEITAFTSDAAKMGIAFDVTADQAGDFMAKWRTSFGLTQKEVIALADKINYLGNTSAAEAAQIANVVTKIGPLGEVAGFASGEIAALGATLVGVGINEDVAATGIKKLMTTMTAGAATTKKQENVLKSLGISSTEMAERMQTDAKGAVLDLMAAFQKLPKAEQAAALKDYFGQEAIGAIAPLLTNLDLLEEQFNKVGDASKYAGSMEEEYAARSKTTENAIQLAKNALNRLSITIGNIFLPMVGEAANKARELITRFSEFAEKHPNVVKAIVGITGGLLAGTAGILALRLGFLKAKSAILAVKGAFVAMKALNLTSKLGGMKAIFAGMSGHLLPIIGIITAIAVAIKLVMGNVDAIREKIRGVFGEGGVAIFDKFVGIINKISGAVKGIFGGGAGGISGFFNSFSQGSPIMEKIGGLIQNVTGTVSQIISVIANAVQSILPTLISIITAIANLIGGALQAVLPVIINIIGQVIDIVSQLLPIIQSVAEFILPILAGAINAVANAIMPIVNFLIPIFVELLNLLMPVIQTVATIFTTVLATAVQQVATLVGGLTGIFSGLIEFITGVFTGNWGQAWAGVKNIFGSAFNALVGLAKAPINAVIGLVNKAIGALNSIKIPSWVPVVGGKGINIPKIPQLWKGSAHTPDTFIAGEQGPELVMGRGGSKVFTAHTTKGIFSSLKDSFLSAKEMLTDFPRPNLAPAGPSLAMAGVGGGRSIVINSQPHFHLMSGDPKEIGKVLDENNEKLKREIKEEMENEEEDRRRRGY